MYVDLIWNTEYCLCFFLIQKKLSNMTRKKEDFDDVGANNIIHSTKGNDRKRQKVVSKQYIGCSKFGNTNIHLNVLEDGDGDDSGGSEFLPVQTQKRKRGLQKRRRISMNRIKKKKEEQREQERKQERMNKKATRKRTRKQKRLKK